ncbi:hypothetical protein H6F89_05685 [Cyanobacteria bacterium FACHB-63]|nr:hypothetical protein [Cyanobacteria bacterium FACHB-63]
MIMPLNYRTLLPVVVLTLATIAAPPTIAVSAPVPTSPMQEFSFSRMGIGGIKLGMKASEVQRRLGKPLKMKSEKSPCCGVLLRWQYAEFEVRLEVPEGANQERNASVYSISTRSAKVATLENVRVGDRRSKVMQVYGTPSTTIQDRIFYSNDANASLLMLRFKNDRVVEIIANTQLN